MNKWDAIKNTARDLRKNQTPAEKILWNILRNRKLGGKKFLRQYPIVIKDSTQPEFYIVDFYCAQYKLIIELDGKIHDFQMEYDQDREAVLKNLGYRIIRFKNKELGDINLVLDRVKISFEVQVLGTHPQPFSTA